MRFPATVFRSFFAALMCLWSTGALAQDTRPLSVRVEVPEGSFYVGEAIDLAVGVTARDQRPALELPELGQADLWTLGTSFRPISTSGIGSQITGDHLFITKLRLVPKRAGMLTIPPVVARLGGRSGKSKPARIRIDPVPLAGRPSTFRGGVGGFSIRAETSPATVQVGQELTFRLIVEGPAALGMSEAPDLGRFEQVPLALRVRPRPVEFNRDPPSRTYVYRIRPTQPGKATLPPVAVASFDPRLGRYITRVSPGQPITAVAVPAFDPETLQYQAPKAGSGGLLSTFWARAALVLAVLSAVLALTILARSRQWIGQRSGPRAARRFARACRAAIPCFVRSGRAR